MNLTNGAQVNFSDLENHLLPAEQLLFKSLFEREICRIDNAVDKLDLKEIRAALLAKLLRGEVLVEGKKAYADSQRIRIYGAHITGNLNLNGSSYKAHLSIRDSTFLGRIMLSDAELDSLDLQGSACEGIVGSRFSTRGNLNLSRGFTSSSTVRLIGCKIGGDLILSGSTFKSKASSLNLTRANIKGSVSIKKGFSALGEVCFSESSIGGSVFVAEASITGTEKSMTFDGARIEKDVFIDKTRLKGELRFYGAYVGGNMELTSIKCESIDADSHSLNAIRSEISGNIFLERCVLDGSSTMWGAEIKGSLMCKGTILKIGPAKSFRDVDLSNLQTVFNCENINVHHNIELNSGFFCSGNCDFTNATINGAFIVRNREPTSEYEKKQDKTTHIYSLVLLGARISGALNTRRRAKIYRLDLRDATVTTIIDDKSSWPLENHLLLDRFNYQGFGGASPRKWLERLHWLQRQPAEDIWSKNFKTQPFTQLASVLRNMGQDSDAKQILIKKQQYHAQSGINKSPFARMWTWLLGMLMDYGYRPLKAFYLVFGLIFVGALFFQMAYQEHSIVPTKKRAVLGQKYVFCEEVPLNYPQFNAIVYSIDALVPFVDLVLEDHWHPRFDITRLPQTCPETSAEIAAAEAVVKSGASVRTSYIYPLYYYFHVAMGWLLATLFVGGITGLVKRD